MHETRRRGGLMKIKFYEEVDDEKLLFAVIVAKYKEQWVFCKHKQRNSYELCGGHREANESSLDCARREFYEESGAKEYQLIPLCVYSCLGKTRVKESSDEHETFGMLYYAEVYDFDELPESEIQEIAFFTDVKKIPEWTYPQIQPILFAKAQSMLTKK